MRVPDEVRQCVLYLGLPAHTPDGTERMRPIGTAFFVNVPSEALQDWSYTYVVTAKHVAEALQGQLFLIRLNTKGGGSIFLRCLPDIRWWSHPRDDSVDVALFPWAPPPTIEHKRVPLSMFLTDEIIRSKSIGAGDEVFITGLFIHLAGSQRNLPIVRMGSIAMMPNEPVPARDGPTDAYLIEARSIGGLSGSPAFVRETAPFGTGAFYLLGLMHGHWDIPVEEMGDFAFADQTDERARVNMGIAIVVPAKKILEVLNHPDLVEGRARSDEQRRKELQPRLDETSEAG